VPNFKNPKKLRLPLTREVVWFCIGLPTDRLFLCCDLFWQPPFSEPFFSTPRFLACLPLSLIGVSAGITSCIAYFMEIQLSRVLHLSPLYSHQSLAGKIDHPCCRIYKIFTLGRFIPLLMVPLVKRLDRAPSRMFTKNSHLENLFHLFLLTKTGSSEYPSLLCRKINGSRCGEGAFIVLS